MKASKARVPQRKPKLGQHFLQDASVGARIVEALGDLSQSTVLEIGPGRGAITSMLVRRARRVIAVETDRVLAAQLRMNFSLTPNIEIIEGDILAIDATSARVAGKAPVGRILIDGTRTGEVGDEVLRDRRHLAEDGLVVPVIAINKQTGQLEGVPDIITRGFVMENSQELLADGARVLSEVVDNASVEERTDQGLIKEKLRVELRRFFRKRSGRRPFVLPVIMEI